MGKDSGGNATYGLYLNKDSWGWLDYIGLKRQSGIKKVNKTSVQIVGWWISELAVSVLLDSRQFCVQEMGEDGEGMGGDKEYCKGPDDLAEDSSNWRVIHSHQRFLKD